MTWPLPNWQMAIVSLALGLLTYFAYDNQGLRHDRDELQFANGQLMQNLRIQSDLQIRANAIDSQRTKELNHAKSQIDDLERAVADGSRRLQLNAICKSTANAATGSVVDGTSPRLTDSAERDYFTLRKRIEINNSQIAGLQDYIREMCLR